MGKLINFKYRVPALTRVDISHMAITDPGVHWLSKNGFRMKVDERNGRVYMVRSS